MKKIKLNISQLEVESFKTSSTKKTKGTLIANAGVSNHPDNCTNAECTGETCPIETCEIACHTVDVYENTCVAGCSDGPVCTDGSCGGPIISCEKICIP